MAHAPLLDPQPPPMHLVIAKAIFYTGVHEMYQIPVVIKGDQRAEWARLGSRREGSSFDPLAEHRDAARLMSLIEAGGRVPSDDGWVSFHWADGCRPASGQATARPIFLDHPNSSVVVGEGAVLKIYRRIEPGVNPELELLRFLGGRGFGSVLPLLGWFSYRGRSISATSGVLEQFDPDGSDGRQWALDSLAEDRDALLGPLWALGAALARMHSVLASDRSDPNFAPVEGGGEYLALFCAELDDKIDRIEPALATGDLGKAAGDAIAAHRQQLRMAERIRHTGARIRIHGNLHLGQTLRVKGDWKITNFEGDPTRTLADRRTKHSPLRDVAGMLHSIDFLASAHRAHGVEEPLGRETHMRQSFLDGYLDSVDPALVPPDRDDIDRLLALYESERAVDVLSRLGPRGR